MTGSSIRLVAILVASQLVPAPDVIRGVVIEAGTAVHQPLQDARLEISGSRTTLVARTDGNGRFTFSNLAPGQYRLTVTCDGFIRQGFPETITLGGGKPATDIVFELERAPTAAGRVVNSYGEPIPNMIVEALRRSYDVRGNPRFVRVASAFTDDRGDYRIFWLDPGGYFFYVTSPPAGRDIEAVNGVAPTFFPGVNTPEDAKSVRLEIGRDVRVDFRIRDAALWRVIGQTIHGPTGRPLEADITLASPNGDPGLSQYHVQSSGRYPGEFSMDKVAPGSYILMAKSGLGDQEVSAIQHIEIPSVVTAPPQGYGVSLNLSRPLVMAGRLFVESSGVAGVRGASVALISIDPDLPSPGTVLVKPDGQFVFNGVVPGSYVLEMSNLPQDLYFKAARFGQDDILETPLTLSARDEPKSLQILLGSDGGRLQAAAYNDKRELHSGTQFVLVPEMARRSRRELYRLATSGEDGRAMFRGIPPGNYKLFAWEHVEPYAYLNSNFLLRYEDSGVRLSIASGDNPPAAVRLIPKD
jgi:protocatechuate 3,4-dioxygenase beta subunit